MLNKNMVYDLCDDAGLYPGKLLVSPLVEQGVGHNVGDDPQLAAPDSQSG